MPYSDLAVTAECYASVSCLNGLFFHGSRVHIVSVRHYKRQG